MGYYRIQWQCNIVPVLHQIFHKVGVNCVKAKHSTTHSGSVKHYNWAFRATVVASQSYFKLKT